MNLKWKGKNVKHPTWSYIVILKLGEVNYALRNRIRFQPVRLTLRKQSQGEVEEPINNNLMKSGNGWVGHSGIYTAPIKSKNTKKQKFCMEQIFIFSNNSYNRNQMVRSFIDFLQNKVQYIKDLRQKFLLLQVFK